MGKEDAEDSNDGQARELEVGTSRARTNPGGKDFPPLSEMASRSLANIEANNQLSTLHRVWHYELHDPDYRLVCAWAEETGWSKNKVLECLLDAKAEVSEGRFVKLVLREPLNSIPLIEGLEVRILCWPDQWDWFTNNRFSEQNYHHRLTELNLPPVPNLKELNCCYNELAQLDLTPVPNLEVLACYDNKLTELDLTPVPNLKELDCDSNNLTELYLTPVRNLKKLDCNHNNLTELDLTPVPNLKELNCGQNQLAQLDLTPVPNLEVLACYDNNLTELDLTPVRNLKELHCKKNNLTELDLTPVPNLKELDCDNNVKAGAREIYHKTCEKCEGSGSLEIRSNRLCTQCSGQGWLTVDNEDIVCPVCNGDGETENINTRECEECKGKGNFPRVVKEVSVIYRDCDSCGGHGGTSTWGCRNCRSGAEIGDYWDGKRCVMCARDAVKIFTPCPECSGSAGILCRTLKDINTGEEYEVEEYAPIEDDEEDEHEG